MFNNLLFIKGGIQHYQLDLLALNDTMVVCIYIYIFYKSGLVECKLSALFTTFLC
jgi:hypothetical protein